MKLQLRTPPVAVSWQVIATAFDVPVPLKV